MDVGAMNSDMVSIEIDDHTFIEGMIDSKTYDAMPRNIRHMDVDRVPLLQPRS
jgi:hypothetical protein